MIMNIAVVVGHSKLKGGIRTSADGTKNGGVNEYFWCKRFSKNLTNQLRLQGNTVTRIICPERKFTKSTDERYYKLQTKKLATKKYDLIIECHLNASDNLTAHGAECLYVSEKGKKYANKIMKGLEKTFYNRGAKKRNDLYMLNATASPCVIMETFFCTNSNDYLKGKGQAKRKAIAKNVAKALGNKAV